MISTTIIISTVLLIIVLDVNYIESFTILQNNHGTKNLKFTNICHPILSTTTTTITTTTRKTSSSHRASTELYKVRRGRLGSEIDVNALADIAAATAAVTKKKTATTTTTTTTTVTKKETTTTKTKKGTSKKLSSDSKTTSSSSTGGAAISPDLMKWLATKEESSSSSSVPEVNPFVADTVVVTEDEPIISTTSSTVYTTFQEERNKKSKKNKKQQKQDENNDSFVNRNQDIQQYQQYRTQMVEELQEIITSSKNNLNDILDQLQKIISPSSNDVQLSISDQREQQVSVMNNLGKGTKRVITSSLNDNTNYKLLWVGSDDSICHIGTGLHKVPLARLQEVFITFPTSLLSSSKGKTTTSRRIELREVISILGPFPNVRNQLQGTLNMKPTSLSAIADDSTTKPVVVGDWIITWDSMIDGTGKELLAGNVEQNTRIVPLNVLYCDENLLIVVVPPVVVGSNDDDNNTDSLLSTTNTKAMGLSRTKPQKQQKRNPSTATIVGRRNNPFEENGKHILVFIKEDDMEGKLDALRVL